jgi:hypothetical protein
LKLTFDTFRWAYGTETHPWNWLKYLCGFLHLKPTAGCLMSTLIKQFMGKGGSINIPCKIPDCKVLTHLGFKSNVLPIPLTDLSAWVDFCISYPQQGVKCQLR